MCQSILLWMNGKVGNPYRHWTLLSGFPQDPLFSGICWLPILFMFLLLGVTQVNIIVIVQQLSALYINFKIRRYIYIQYKVILRVMVKYGVYPYPYLYIIYNEKVIYFLPIIHSETYRNYTGFCMFILRVVFSKTVSVKLQYDTKIVYNKSERDSLHFVYNSLFLAVSLGCSRRSHTQIDLYIVHSLCMCLLYTTVTKCRIRIVHTW